MLVDVFAKFTQLAIRLHRAGRPGLLSSEDFRQLSNLETCTNWKLYNNSRGITHLSSPEGDHIQIDDQGIEVFGSRVERR